MSGHSHFANMKRTKGKTDSERAKIFTKMGRELSVAAKGGSDSATNSKLRDAIAKAHKLNMTNDGITRAVKKGSESGSENFDEVIYEGYGKDGVAILVIALTDNRNRTAGEVRCAFDKYGNGLGTQNSVSFMFNKIGEIYIDKNSASEDDLFLLVSENGAENFEVEEENYRITCLPNNYSILMDILVKNKIATVEADIIFDSNIKVELNDSQWENLDKLIAKLEESDDVQNVFTNAN